MSRRTKHSYFSDNIKNLHNPITKRVTLEQTMHYAFKYVLAEGFRDLPLPILVNNASYQRMVNDFDNIDDDDVKQLFANPQDSRAIAIKAIVKRPHRKNIRRSKKQISRIAREVKRAIREASLGNNNGEYKAGIEALCDATKEAFVVLRQQIHPDVYSSIPNNEMVTFPSNNNQEHLNNLFILKTINNRKNQNEQYEIKSKFSYEDAHAIQYSLAKYSFRYYYKR